MTPLISVIIPTYNRANLIGETLVSIQKQTYQKWECIIVDDSSTDNTEEVVRTYIETDSRITYYKKPKQLPKGPSAARNYGFEKSKGDYINWFDSDDLMHPEKLEIDLKNIQSGDYDFTISQSKFFNENGEPTKEFWNNNLWSDDPINDFITLRIGWGVNSPIWLKNSLLKCNLSFDEELLTADDYLYHILSLKNSLKPVIINKTLTYLREHKYRLNDFSLKSPYKLKVNLYLLRNARLLRLNHNTLKFLNSQFESQISNLLKNKKLNKSLSFLSQGYSSSLNKSTKISASKLFVFGVFYRCFGIGYRFLK